MTYMQIAKAFEYVDDDYLCSVEQMKKPRSAWRGVWKKVAVVFLALLIGASVWLAVDEEARAAFLNALLWLRGEQIDATIETTDKGQYTDYTVTYVDENGKTQERGGAAVAYDEDGTQRPVTEEDIIDSWNTHADVEYLKDGSVWLYYKDQKVDITDKFENGVCVVELQDGEYDVKVAVRYQGTWTVNREPSDVADSFGGEDTRQSNDAGQISVGTGCIYWDADLDGDGNAERIGLDIGALEGKPFTLPWIETLDGEKLCELNPIGIPHPASNSYALTELDGKTYLMEYQTLISADTAKYTCCLWTVNAKTGRLTQGSVKQVDFPTNHSLTEAQRESVSSFMNEANQLWQHSRLLFSTDPDVLVHLYNAETGQSIEPNGSYFLADTDASVRYQETMNGGHL